jgi:PAS domain S-box-containing protein
MLIVSPGGRIIYTSPQTRELFGLPDEQIDLERLALLVQPNEALLYLCQQEATASFRLEENQVEGTSYYLPYGSNILLMVSFQVNSIEEEPAEGVINSFVQSYGHNTFQKYSDVLTTFIQVTSTTIDDLEKIKQAVVESLKKLTKADLLRITIWNKEEDLLIPLIHHGFHRLETQIDRNSSEAYHGKYSRYLLKNRKPLLLISDENSTQAFQVKERSQHSHYRSYMGVPLFVADEVIGTLELGSISQNAFSEDDLSFLYWFSGNIATAIHVAKNPHQSENLSVELDELLHLTKIFENRDTESILDRETVEQIASILKVEILGLLEFSDNHQFLFALNPFLGLPPDFVELYQITIPTNGNQEKSLSLSQVINSSNTSEDLRLKALGLDHPARAAGMHHTLLVPLIVNDDCIGYIQAANKKNGEPFDKFEEKLLTIIAYIIGSTIYKSDQKETNQGLINFTKKIISLFQLISSDVKLNGNMQEILQELTQFLNADYAALFFAKIGEENTPLHLSSHIGLPEDLIDYYIQPDAADKHQIDRSNEIKNIRIYHPQEYENIGAHYYQPIFSRIAPQSLVKAPLVLNNEWYGDLLVGFDESYSPNEEEILVIETITGQIASSQHENNHIFQAHECKDKHSLQQPNRVSDFITAGLEVVKTINQTIDRYEMLSSLGEGILNYLNSDVVIIVESNIHGPKLVCSFGEISKTLNLDKLLGKRNPIHHTLLSGEIILIDDIVSSKDWESSPLITAIKANSFFCIPIKANEQTEVALLAANHTTIPALTEADEKIIALLSFQISSVFQHIKSLDETRHHLREVNLLLDFSRQIGSMDADQTLDTLLKSVKKIVPAAQAGFIATWDDQSKGLRPVNTFGYKKEFQLKEIKFSLNNSLPGHVYKCQSPIRIDKVDFVAKYNLSPEDLLRYQDATAGKLPIASLGIPIMGVITPQGKPDEPDFRGVIILDNFDTPAAFNEDDQAIIKSLLHQTILSLENLSLYQATEQHAGQLQALTSMASMISSSLNSDDLVASILDQLETVVYFDTGTLWLNKDDRLTIRAARGFDDSEERIGLSVAIDDSRLFNEMVVKGKPISVDDIHQDSRFPSLLDHPYHSWLGIPLIAKDRILGVIALEKIEANFYSDEKVQLALTFSGQAAVALVNASLFEESILRTDELVKRSQRLAMLNRLSNELGQTLDIDQIYNICLRNLVAAVECSSASAVLFQVNSDNGSQSSVQPNETENAILTSEYPNSSNILPEELPDMPIFNHIRQSLGVFSTDNARGEKELRAISKIIEGRNIESLLILPVATREDFYGLILVINNKTHYYTSEEIKLARTITNQTAISLENAKLFEKTQNLTVGLEERVEERTAQLALAHQQSEILLRITTALSSSLDMDLVLNNTLNILNEDVKADQLICILWRPGESNKSHFVSLNEVALSQNDDPALCPSPIELFANHVAMTRDPVLVTNIHDQEHNDIQIPLIDQYCSALGVPILIGDELIGALLMFHNDAEYFSSEQLDLIQAVTNQIAVAINNSELYYLIREQAEELGNLLHAQEVETTRSQAILESIAEGVMVTDSENRITHFNVAGEDILQLERKEVLGKSLDHFIGLFGNAAHSWIKTIKRWSYKSKSSKLEEIFSEQIKLDSNRIVSVHLAPVVSSNQFLGTVSIFHDITHQVEVDRLKSEFVANVSHELRTPMTSIKGYVDILLMGATGALSNQQNQFLNIIRENSDRLTGLVDDLLDISRIESGHQSLSFQSIDLRPMFEEVLMDLNRRAKDEEKRLEIEFNKPAQIPDVKGDPERIRQIIFNLMDNAYNYTLDNGRIKIHLLSKNNEVLVQVEDNGIGICIEEQDRVFNRFYRGEHPKVLETSGTGLGLAVVKHLVEMHHGKIWIESSGIPGEGSSFFFTLPIHNNASNISHEHTLIK